MLRAVEMNIPTTSNSHTTRSITDASSPAFSILLSSRDRTELDRLVATASEISNVDIRTNHICNGHCDPLHGIDSLPNLLVFQIGAHWKEELEELIRRPSRQRPPIIIIGDTQDQQTMRLAMRAGASDYIKSGFEAAELQGAIRDFIMQGEQEIASLPAPIVAVINAKGGSGGSLIASNIAHLMSVTGRNVALIDLDLQFGSLCHYLDMEPKYGLIEALNNVYDLDERALENFMLKHSSGLHLLDVKPGELLIPEDIRLENMHILLELMANHYNQIIIDLPRYIGPLSSMVLEKSDKVIVVVQQSIAHIRDAKRLMQILQQDIGIPVDKICVVLNRYDKKSDLTVSDIEKAIRHDVDTTVPNAFQQVSQSINEGKPLYDIAKKSAISRAIDNLSKSLTNPEKVHQQQSGFISRILQRMRGE